MFWRFDFSYSFDISSDFLRGGKMLMFKYILADKFLQIPCLHIFLECW